MGERLRRWDAPGDLQVLSSEMSESDVRDLLPSLEQRDMFGDCQTDMETPSQYMVALENAFHVIRSRVLKETGKVLRLSKREDEPDVISSSSL